MRDSFGIISCEDNLECGPDPKIKEEYQLIEGSCGEITIMRRWSATDWLPEDGGNQSQYRTQEITINKRENWSLMFPTDATVNVEKEVYLHLLLMTKSFGLVLAITLS